MMTSTPRSFRLPPVSAFDRTIGLAILLIIGAIIGVIALGDRVGVTIERAAPLGTAHSTSPIRIQFSDVMQRETVESRFRIEPAVPGTFSWSASTLTFRPTMALRPGSTYTVTLDAGANAQGGRQVLSAYTFSFTVGTPRVAYLYPADGFPQNIWIADPLNPDAAYQLTDSPSGIYDFAVSPDGTQIAFSENNTNGTNDIKVIDLENGALRQLTNCVDAACTSPEWRPDGALIAYTRVDFNSALASQGVGASPARVWLVDPLANPPVTRPLFDELQILGFSQQWSADGTRIAVFDSATAAILVYNLNDGSIIGVPSRAGSSGALSPDGTRLVYPEVTLIESVGTRTSLRAADLLSGEIGYISTPDDPVDDQRAVWSPDGRYLAIARRDETFARTYQIYILEMDGITPVGQARRLTDDPRYANNFFRWDPTGTQLVIQRFPELDETGQPNNLGRPEIWTVDVATGRLTRIVENGFIPRWIP
ncbi:MAG: Ig-like domain-containing protein [Candidatus Flexifilum sp.]